MISYIVAWLLIGFLSAMAFSKIDQGYVRVIDFFLCIALSLLGPAMLLIFILYCNKPLNKWLVKSFMMNKLF